jgi:FkbM family methyltransferase
VSATTQSMANAFELEDVLRRIQAESLESVRARERNAFNNIADPFNERLVLFGAGPLGKAILAGLRRAGVEPLAFADNKIGGERASKPPLNEGPSGKDTAHRQVMGLPVLSAAEAVERYGQTACFVVTIYQGAAVRHQLASLGCRRIAHFVPLFWKYADCFIPQSGIELPHRIVEQCTAIRSCYAALADDFSKRELCEQLEWRYWLDDSVLSPALAAPGIYFPMDLLSPNHREVFVDCGAFDGDSLGSFHEHWGGKFRQAFCFEPDPANRAALASNVETMHLGDRVTTLPYAVGNMNGAISFSCTGSAASHVTGAERVPAIECRRLDDIEWPLTPTYIKMDIESAEPEALTGAAKLLRRHHPVLAVCTYHRSEHLWQIPNLIRSIAPEYHLFLRRYAEDCWEGVCYAIPTERWRKL